LEDYSDKLDDEAKDFLKRISASANRMKNMIGDLLTLSRFSKMESSFESIVPETIIKSALKRIEPIISEKNVQIKIADDLPIIYGDKVKLVEVFYNLISNAIKYNNREKPIIEIDQPMPQPAKDEVVIYVKDNGIGIEEQYYEEIFKIFKRLHTREEYGGGTGVGLPIVRKIMDDHNGRVWLESKVEQGTTFYLAFPKKVIGNL
ncbi:MAG: ATP-binding protein, partial [bacterium]